MAEPQDQSKDVVLKDRLSPWLAQNKPDVFKGLLMDEIDKNSRVNSLVGYLESNLRL